MNLKLKNKDIKFLRSNVKRKYNNYAIFTLFSKLKFYLAKVYS